MFGHEVIGKGQNIEMDRDHMVQINKQYSANSRYFPDRGIKQVKWTGLQTFIGPDQ